MYKFKKSIPVEVSADAFAIQLLEIISPDFDNREALVEAIVGTSMNKTENIQHIYNAFYGITPKVQFAINEFVNCTSKVYMYVSEKSRATRDSEYVEIGKALIKDINPYRSDSLLVEYDFHDSNGNIRRETRWVEPERCSLYSEPNVLVQEDIFD